MADILDPIASIQAKYDGMSGNSDVLSAAQKCGPGGDCSSFTQKALGNMGIKGVPRTAIEQIRAATPVTSTSDTSKMSPGDLVFFDNNSRTAYNTGGGSKAYNGGYVNHVGMYIGNGNFIADHGEGDPSTRTPQDLNQYLKRTGYKFMGAGRFGGNPVGGGSPEADTLAGLQAKYSAPDDALGTLQAKYSGSLGNALTQAAQTTSPQPPHGSMTLPDGSRVAYGNQGVNRTVDTSIRDPLGTPQNQVPDMPKVGVDLVGAGLAPASNPLGDAYQIPSGSPTPGSFTGISPLQRERGTAQQSAKEKAAALKAQADQDALSDEPDPTDMATMIQGQKEKGLFGKPLTKFNDPGEYQGTLWHDVVAHTHLDSAMGWIGDQIDGVTNAILQQLQPGMEPKHTMHWLLSEPSTALPAFAAAVPDAGAQATDNLGVGMLGMKPGWWNQNPENADAVNLQKGIIGIAQFLPALGAGTITQLGARGIGLGLGFEGASTGGELAALGHAMAGQVGISFGMGMAGQVMDDPTKIPMQLWNSIAFWQDTDENGKPISNSEKMFRAINLVAMGGGLVIGGAIGKRYVTEGKIVDALVNKFGHDGLTPEGARQAVDMFKNQLASNRSLPQTITDFFSADRLKDAASEWAHQRENVGDKGAAFAENPGTGQPTFRPKTEPTKGVDVKTGPDSHTNWTPQQWAQASIDPDFNPEFKAEFEEARRNASKAQKVIDSPDATSQEKQLAQEVLDQSNKMGKVAQFSLSEPVFNERYGAMTDALNTLNKHLSDTFEKGPDEQARLDRVFGNKPKAEPPPGTPPVQAPSKALPTEGFSVDVPKSQTAQGFTTAKGSTYEINPDGTTTRNKMARPEHPGDEGPQPTKPAVSTPESSGHGISQALLDQRAKAGEIEPVKPGTGTSPEDQIKAGRAAIKAGASPVETLRALEAGTIHHADIPRALAILRAHTENLATLARQALAAGDHARFEQLKTGESNWQARIKPIATSASETFRGLQGQVDLNTGDWTELAARKRDVAGRPLAEGETNAAKQLARTVAERDAQIARLSKYLDEALKDRTPQAAKPRTLPSDPVALRAHFAKRIEDQSIFNPPRVGGKKSGAVGLGTPGKPIFTPEEIRAIWNHAKEHYIDPVAKTGGLLNIGDVADGTALDLGLHPDWVKDVIAGRKTPAAAITADMYRAMSERRKAVRQAQDWANAQPSSIGRTVADTWRFLRQAPGRLAVAGHGTVSMFSHAGADLFGDSKVWGQHFTKQFKLAYSEPFHEEMMQSMERLPAYNQMLQDGLKVDRSFREDYGFFSKLSQATVGKLGKLDAAKGMDILKPLRATQYMRYMENAPEWAKADPNFGKLVANLVNHSTGAGNIEWMGPTIAKAAREVAFAPSLEAARWSNMIGDTTKTAKTFANWRNATPGEKYVAQIRLKRAARIMAMYGTALAVNQGILSATGQSQNINFLDPSRADWLQFKWGKSTFDPLGGRVSPLRESFNMLHALYNDVTGQKNPYKKGVFDQLEQIGRNKLAPQYQIVADIGTREAVGGRPVPWSADAGSGDFTRMSWPEYFSSKMPIPLADASKAYFEGLRDGGVDQNTAGKMVLRLLIAGTGLREGVASAKGTNQDPIARGISGLVGGLKN